MARENARYGLLLGLLMAGPTHLVEPSSAAKEVCSTGESPDPLPALLVRLRSKEKSVREQAETELCELQDATVVVPDLLTILQDDSASSKVRRASARVLGRLGLAEERVILALNKVLVDRKGKSKLRAEAAESLVRLNSLSNSLLFEALQETTGMGYRVARSISISSDPSEYISVLVRCIEGDSRPGRLHALYGLGYLGPKAEAAVPPLKRLLKKLRAKEPQMARDVPGVKAALAYIETDPEALAEAFIEGGPLFGQRKELVVPALMRVLQCDDSDARERAARTFSKMGRDSSPAVPLLLRALKDPAEEVRYYAGFTLLAYHAEVPDVVPSVLELLKDKSKMVHFWLFGDEEGMISDLPRASKNRLRSGLREFMDREKERDPSAYRAAVSALDVIE